MSNFKRKINIVESSTPPTNQYDWWYDLNNGVLKKPSGKGWKVVGGEGTTSGTSEVLRISDTWELRSLILNKQLIPGATYVISSKCIKSDLHDITSSGATMHTVSSDYDIIVTATSTNTLDCCAYFLPTGMYEDQAMLFSSDSEMLPCQLNTCNINKVGYVWCNYEVAPSNTTIGGAIYRADFISSVAFDADYPELGEAALYALNKYGEDAWIHPVEFGCPDTTYFEGAMFLIGSEKNPNSYTAIGSDGTTIYLEEDIYTEGVAQTNLWVEFGVINITNIDNRFDRLYTGKYRVVFYEDYYWSRLGEQNLQIDIFNSSIIIKNSKIVFAENYLAGGDSNTVKIIQNCNIQNSKLWLSVDNVANTYLSNYYGPLYGNFSATNSQVGPSVQYVYDYILWGWGIERGNLFGDFLSNSNSVDLYSSSIYYNAYEQGAEWNEDMPGVLTEEFMKVRLHNIVFDELSSPMGPPDNYLGQFAWVEPSGGFSWENQMITYEGGSNVKHVGTK